MSYILDAVRKADQERRENLVPAAHSLSAQSQARMPVKSRAALQWPALIAGVLAINAAAWYWYSQSTLEQPQVANSGHTPQQAEMTEAVAPDSLVPVLPGVSDKRPAEIAQVKLWQAPVEVQNIVRSLQFSFHVYANDPGKRTIIINGQRAVEKEIISQDLRLDEITSSGVVLMYQNKLLIEVEILEQW